MKTLRNLVIAAGLLVVSACTVMAVQWYGVVDYGISVGTQYVLKIVDGNNSPGINFYGSGGTIKRGSISSGATAALAVQDANDNFRFVILQSGKVGIGTIAPKTNLQVVGLPVYADNASAAAAGLTAGAFYRTGGDPDQLCVVH